MGVRFIATFVKMMRGFNIDSNSILKEALNLRPADRLRLVELLTKSLSKPDEQLDKLWAEESEKRFEAVIRGTVKSIPLDEIIRKYK